MTAINGIDRLAELRALSVLDAAAALGLTVTCGHGIGPCPACGANTRHPKRGDKRGALGVRSDGRGWRCFECDASGDTVRLAALVLLGAVPAAGDARGWRALLDAAAERGLCSAIDGGYVARRVVPRPVPPPKSYPPADEVHALWNACRPITLVPEIAEAWAARGIDVGCAEERDLARALPLGVPVPHWAYGARQYWSDAHRLIVPLFDCNGRLTSLHARATKAPAPDVPKALTPKGYQSKHLVMADGLGQAMLSGAAAPAGLLVAEGVPDFLTWATHFGDAAESPPAILSIISGAWSEEIAARVPSGIRVGVWTHEDADGEEYATEILSTLGVRCRCWRGRLSRVVSQ